MGGGPSWSIQAARRVSRGYSRSHACVVASIQAGAGDGHGLLATPSGRVTEDELAAVLGRAAALYGVNPRRRRSAHDSVGAQPAEDLDGQVAQQVSDARCVVSGVQHDQDVGVARLPLTDGDESLNDVTNLDRGPCDDVSSRSRVK